MCDTACVFVFPFMDISTDADTVEQLYLMRLYLRILLTFTQTNSVLHTTNKKTPTELFNSNLPTGPQLLHKVETKSGLRWTEHSVRNISQIREHNTILIVHLVINNVYNIKETKCTKYAKLTHVYVNKSNQNWHI